LKKKVLILALTLFIAPLSIYVLSVSIATEDNYNIGLVMTDIKRVIAYSTISQLGLMLAALELASELGWTASTFHILNQSLFKALLFLASGPLCMPLGQQTLNR